MNNTKTVIACLLSLATLFAIDTNTNVSNRGELQTIGVEVNSSSIPSEISVAEVMKEVEVKQPVVIATKTVAVSRGGERINMGTFTITAYCDCEKCCGKTDGITFSGTKVKEGRTIAVDPKLIPIGTEVNIEGVGNRIAEDIGGVIKGKHIDLFFDNHEDALEFGRQKLKVTIVK